FLKSTKRNHLHLINAGLTTAIYLIFIFVRSIYPMVYLSGMRNIMRNYVFCCILALLCLPYGSQAQEVVFSAKASSAKTGLQNQFQITFSLSNAPEAQNFTPPSFEGFSIQGGPFQSSRSSMSNINGRVQQNTTVSLTYILQATK